MISQLDTETADLDVTSEIVALTHTPDASNPRMCYGAVYLGDGIKDLDGTGGNFTLRVNLASQYGQTLTIAVPAQARAVLQTGVVLVPANVALTLRVLSPNGADTDVTVTAYLFALDTTVVAATVSDKTGYSLHGDYDAAKTAAQATVCTEERLAELDAANLPADVDAILSDTGTTGVALAADSIKAVTFDESTAFPLKYTDAGATKVARTGGDGDTLETLSDEIATAVTSIDGGATPVKRTLIEKILYGPGS